MIVRLTLMALFAIALIAGCIRQAFSQATSAQAQLNGSVCAPRLRRTSGHWLKGALCQQAKTNSTCR
jgi:hypothetical protein